MAEAQRAEGRGDARFDWPLGSVDFVADPILIVNPPDDRAFVNAVRSAFLSGARTPEALRRALQSAYPDVVVRPRDLAHEMFAAWYVYRDGHWTPRASSRPDRS